MVDPALELVSVVRDLAKARSFEEVQAVIRDRTRALFASDGVALVLREGDQVRYVDEDAIGPLWKGQRFPINACVSGVAIRTREPVLVTDIFADPRVPAEPYVGTFVKSLAMVPVGREDPIGAIGVYWSEHHEVTDQEDQLLRALAAAAAVAIENARLIERLESEKRFSYSVIDSLPGLFFFIDETPRLVRWNRNVTRVTGYGDDEIISMHPVEFFSASDRGRIADQIAHGFKKGSVSVQADLLTKDGRTVPYVFSGVRTRLDGRAHLLGVGIDLSNRIALEHQLRQAQKLEALGRLAGGIAHDFNNLLTCILSLASMAELHSTRGSSADEELREISDIAMRAGGITRQLLAFVRQSPLEVRVCDLNLVVAELERMLRRLVSDGIFIRTQAAREPAWVEADRSQLEQILVNLIINASDAMPDGGAIEIEVACREDTVELNVSDNGVGIPAELRDKIFEPFFTTKEQESGTGLGLATVYEIVRQSGGDIEVVSEVDQGTSFRVQLPRAAAPSTDRMASSRLRKLIGRDEKILLVEQEPTVRRVVADALNQHGYTVITAASADEAQALARDCEPSIDVLLTNVILPGITGPKLRASMGRDGDLPRVVYMSGYPADVLSRYDIEGSDSRLLRKPFSIDELCRAIRDSLDAPR
jgi:two-component system, cell cycle sensor histidine kinase and response regulator CckA